MARVLRGHESKGKHSVRNLRYGPRTRLVRGISALSCYFQNQLWYYWCKLRAFSNIPCFLNPSLHIGIVLTCLKSVRSWRFVHTVSGWFFWFSRLTSRDHKFWPVICITLYLHIFLSVSLDLLFSLRSRALPNETKWFQKMQVSWDLTQTNCKYVQIITMFTPSANFDQLLVDSDLTKARAMKNALRGTNDGYNLT